jgi:tRNA (guanine37-N1)-methyltransferase
MQIDILTLFPEMFDSLFAHSIINRAKKKELVTINLHNIRDFALGKHRSVDDYAYGGGAGMVMMIEPIARCMEHLKSKTLYDQVIYMSPDGKQLTQKVANHLSTFANIMILCGHYKGIDERIREHLVTMEISIGDYVLSGGELPAAVLIDAMVRIIPGAMNDECSALSDSYQDDLLSPPVYTHPYDYKGWKVPDILLSGNDKEISKWCHDQAMERTKQRRPRLLEG